MNEVIIDGNSLTLDKILLVAYGLAKVSLGKNVRKHVEKSRKLIEDAVRKNEIIYGVTTGFGKLATLIVPREVAEKIQINIIRSHSAGVGEYLPKEIVRAMLLIRANTLAKGYSGVRYEIIKMLLDVLNSDLIPLIPKFGSVGASGDLAPLAHMVAVIIGDKDAKAIYKDEVISDNELRKVLLKIYSQDEEIRHLVEGKTESTVPLVSLSFKEGLALCNGTSATAAVIAVALDRMSKIAKVADLALALSLEAIVGITDAFNKKANELRALNGQVVVAENILRLVNGSKLATESTYRIPLNEICEIKETKDGILLKVKTTANMYGIDVMKLVHVFSSIFKMKVSIVNESEIAIYGVEAKKLQELAIEKKHLGYVQDAYSFRCAPHIHGSFREILSFATKILEKEVNAAVDNPLVIPEENKIISCGNFHGQMLSILSDMLSISLVSLLNASERRIFQLLSPELNRGLPAFLAFNPGENSGLMLAQYTAAALLAECRSLSSPRSVHSIPTSADQEDVVSMSMNAALRLLDMIELAKRILSIELLTAMQAILIRTNGDLTMLGEGTRVLARTIIDILNFHGLKLPIVKDQNLNKYIETIYNKLDIILKKCEEVNLI